MPGEWTEVRTSVPAEQVNGVPDNAYAYAVWDRGDRSVTVYLAEDLRHTPPRDKFYVVMHHGPDANVYGPYKNDRRALDKAEKLKTEGFIGI